MPKLDDIIETFRNADPETRVEMLLDYARRLPLLPERYRLERDAGLHRVHECMTPVFLWIESDGDGKMHITADVSEESPTVKGFVSLLVSALNGASPREAASVPDDLMDRLGLGDLLRMTRAVGLSAVLIRIKKAAAQLESRRTTGVEREEGADHEHAKNMAT